MTKDLARKIVPIAVALMGVSGCQTMMYGKASDFDELSLGMTHPQVVAKLGEPIEVTSDGDKHEEYLVYKRMKQVMSWGPREYKVTLRDGKVVKWAEKEN